MKNKSMDSRRSKGIKIITPLMHKASRMHRMCDRKIECIFLPKTHTHKRMHRMRRDFRVVNRRRKDTYANP